MASVVARLLEAQRNVDFDALELVLGTRAQRPQLQEQACGCVIC